MKKVLIVVAMIGAMVAGSSMLCMLDMPRVNAAGTVCDGISDPELLEAAGCNENDKIEDKLGGWFAPVIGIVGVIAVCAVIYGGFKFMTSNGDPSKATTARHIILYAVVGLIVALLAVAIVQVVVKTVSQ